VKASSAETGRPVKTILAAAFLPTDLLIVTPGPEQNRPKLALKAI